MKRVLLILASVGLAAFVPETYSQAPVPAGSSDVYVADFELDSANIKSAQGMVSDDAASEDDDGVFPKRGPVRGVLGRIRGEDDNPQATAVKVVNLMADTLVAELKDEDIPAQRIDPSLPKPREGLIVRGVFTQVDEGNRLRRAAIGFGSGKVEIQVYATVSDLAKNPNDPLYRLDANAAKGKMPGAAITLNPYVAAAKFVMSGKDVEKGVKKAARAIAEQLEAKLKPAESQN